MDELRAAQERAASMFCKDQASLALGISVEVVELGTVNASMIIRDDMLNGLGVCHGGLVFALADTAFAFACNSNGRQAITASGHIEFLRPAAEGDELQATATSDHQGRRAGYYTVKVHNQRDELVALFRGRSLTHDKPGARD